MLTDTSYGHWEISRGKHLCVVINKSADSEHFEVIVLRRLSCSIKGPSQDWPRFFFCCCCCFLPLLKIDMHIILCLAHWLWSSDVFLGQLKPIIAWKMNTVYYFLLELSNYVVRVYPVEIIYVTSHWSVRWFFTSDKIKQLQTLSGICLVFNITEAFVICAINRPSFTFA